MKSFINFVKGIVLRGETTDPTDNTPGSLWHNSTTGRIKAYVQTAVRELVSTDQAQTLTNKSVDAATNTITNISNTEVKAGANIARAKLSSGTINAVVINDASGVQTDEATLAKVRGGTGANNSAVTFPSTGVIVTEAGTQTLTNKTLTSPVISGATGITKSDVGLSNVDNTSDATKNAAAVTLTNKTITSPIISTILNASGTLTLPTLTTTLVGRATADTLTNKDLVDSSTQIVDAADPTKRLTFEVAGTTGTSTALVNVQTANRALTLPDITDTLVSKNSVDILQNKNLNTTNGNVFLGIPLSTAVAGQLPIANGGTGAATKATGFDALSPMTTSGDLIYGGTAGTGTRLSAGLANQVLKTVAGVPAWSSVNLSGINYVSANPDAEVDTAGWATYNDTISQPQATLGNGTVDEVGDYINVSTPLGVIEGQSVVYTNSGGTSIGGLTSGLTYRIRNPLPGGGSSSFQLSSTTSGAIIDLTAEGTGTHIFSLPSPYDGTGGTANVTFTRSTVTPLRGTASFVFTKDAANRQGQGVAYTTMTIDSADQGKVLNISADYKVTSGTYADGDLGVYVLDITNNKLLYPSVSSISNTLLNGKISVTFQSNTNSTSYRLMLHVQSVSALAYTMQMDNFAVGPQVVSIGPAVTDWVSYTPSMTGFGTVSANTAEWMRVGGNLMAKGRFTAGTPTAAAATIGFPPGLSYDVTKAFGSSGIYQTRGFGTVWRSLSSGAAVSFPATNIGPFTFTGTASALTSLNISFTTSASGNTLDAGLGSSLSGANDSFVWELEVPIAGWSSGLALSSDVSGRQILTRAVRSNTQVGIPSATPTKILYNQVSIDTIGAYDTSLSRLSIKENGNYSISGAFFLATSSAAYEARAELWINGAVNQYSYAVKTGTAATTFNVNYNFVASLKAGDYVEVYAMQGSGASLSIYGEDSAGNISNFIAEKINTGSQQIAASELIAGSYGAGTTSFPTGGAATIPIYSTKQFDTHGAYNPATGIFTAPANGKYEFRAQVFIGSWTPGSVNNQIQFDLQRNGAGEFGTVVNPALTTTQRNAALNVTYVFDLLVGETINADLQNGTATVLTMTNNAGYSFFQWKRLGN